MDTTNWHDKATELRFNTQAYINGKLTNAISDDTFEIINPATENTSLM